MKQTSYFPQFLLSLVFMLLISGFEVSTSLAAPIGQSGTLDTDLLRLATPDVRDAANSPAAPGDSVANITVPVPAQRLGVSVGFDGTYLYYTNYGDTNLYKIATDGTLVETFNFGINLGAMSWDAGRQKMWAGTLDGSRDIYLVDVATGALEFQFDAPNGRYNFHDGLAYDASDDSLWFSDDVQYTVYHLTTSGAILSTIAVDFPSSGIAVGGPSLYMGSNGWGTIYKVDKANGNILETFATPGGRDEDLECDNITFAPLEVMWSKDAYDNTITAFEVTPGTCQFGIVNSPQGQLQLHVPSVLPNNAAIRPSVTVINEEPEPATYTVIIQLWRGFGQLAERTQTASFVWSGRQRLSFDFGVYAPDHYYVVAELWRDGELLEIETSRFSVGVDFLKLRKVADDLTSAAHSELNDGEDIAVDALARAGATATAESIDFIKDKVIAKVLNLIKIDKIAPTEISQAGEGLLGWMLNFSAAIERHTYDPIAQYWRNTLAERTFNQRRASASNAQTDLLSFAEERSFTWSPVWQTESIRRQAAIQNKNETVGGLGLKLNFESPFVHRASLVEMKGQFVWIDDTLLPAIENWSNWVLVGFVAVLLVAVIIVLLPSSALLALSAAVVGVAKVVVLLLPALYQIFVSLKASKLLIAIIILVLFSINIGGTSEGIVSPEVVKEHRSAMDYLRTNIAGGIQADSSLPVTVAANTGHYKVDLDSRLGVEGSPVWLETQLFRADGQLLKITDYGVVKPATAVGDTHRLPAGTYWALAVAHGKDMTQAEMTTFEVTSPHITLDVTLVAQQLQLNQPLEANLTLINHDTTTGTGPLVLTVMTLDGEGFKLWSPELAPSESITHHYSFLPRHEGGYVLRAVVSNEMETLVGTDRSFVVGDAAALALTVPDQPEYAPEQDIVWTVTAVNAGTQPTNTLLLLNTFDRNHDYTLVYNATRSLAIDAGASTTVDITVLSAALPGAYETHVMLGDRPYKTGDFIVRADGTLFVIADVESAQVPAFQPVTLTATVQNELYNPTDATMNLNLLTPDGKTLDLPLARTDVGQYQATYTAEKSGTYLAAITASKLNYVKGSATTSFTVNEASSLLLDVQGKAALGSTVPVTLSVYNEYLLPVPQAMVIVSGTNGLLVSQTDRTGVAKLTLHPVTTAELAVRVEKTGFASTSLHLPVAVVNDTSAPDLTISVTSLTNQNPLIVRGLTEPGISLVLNNRAVSVDANGRYTATLDLIEGDNLITAIATDGAGNERVVTKTTRLDTMAPNLIVTQPPDGTFTTDKVINVAGTTDPDASVLVGSVEAEVQPDGGFSEWTLIDAPGINTVIISASDRAGNTVTEVRTIHRPGAPGDCNADQSIGASDITALALEFFDGDDNSDPAAAAGGSFAGSPACDANQDNQIGASDITCIALIFFNGPGACGAGQSAAAATAPVLSVADQIPAAAGGQVAVPIVLQSNGSEVSSLLFSLDYDENWLSFDPTDADQDGIPDAITFNLPDQYVRSVTFDPNDTNGELDVMLASFASQPLTLTSGKLLTVTLTTGAPQEPVAAAVQFAKSPAASFGDPQGQTLAGAVESGSVLIGAEAPPEQNPTIYLPFVAGGN